MALRDLSNILHNDVALPNSSLLTAGLATPQNLRLNRSTRKQHSHKQKQKQQRHGHTHHQQEDDNKTYSNILELKLELENEKKNRQDFEEKTNGHFKEVSKELEEIRLLMINSKLHEVPLQNLKEELNQLRAKVYQQDPPLPPSPSFSPRRQAQTQTQAPANPYLYSHPQPRPQPQEQPQEQETNEPLQSQNQYQHNRQHQHQQYHHYNQHNYPEQPQQNYYEQRRQNYQPNAQTYYPDQEQIEREELLLQTHQLKQIKELELDYAHHHQLYEQMLEKYRNLHPANEPSRMYLLESHLTERFDQLSKKRMRIRELHEKIKVLG